MAIPSLNNFIAEIKRGGLARQNRFSVSIGSRDTSNGRIVELFCEQASLPSLSYSSQGVRTYGETRETIYDRNFEAMTLTFLVDKNMEVKTYFDKWMDSIINPDTRNPAYYDTYVRDIVIKVQDVKDHDTYQVVLYEAYPKTVAAVNLDYNSKDIMKLQVTFEYKYHINTQMSTSRGEPDIKNALGFNLPDPYVLSRQLGNYLRGSATNLFSQSDKSNLYFSDFNQYQQQLNDSLSVSNSLERQGFTTGKGSTLG